MRIPTYHRLDALQHPATAILATACAFAPCPTHALGVSLYGAVDSYVSFDSGGRGSSVQMSSGAGSTSRFGMTGAEDFGRGWFAGFRLESGLNTDTGTPQSAGTLFNREANLWLGSREFGMLKLGRQFPTIFPLSSQVDPYTLTKLSIISNVAYVASDLGGNAVAIDSRVPSAVSYTTPNLNGFSAQGLYGFNTSNTTGSPAHYAGGLAQYEGGPLYVGISVNTVRSAQSDATDHYGAGVAYRLGDNTISLGYNLVVPKQATGHVANAYLLGLTLPYGPHIVRLSVVGRVVSGADNRTVAALLGYDYQFSKRTALYSRLAYLANSGNAALTLDSALTSAGRDVLVSAFGITHRF